MGKKNAYMGLSKKGIVDVLVGAFEGGSNNWYQIKNIKKPTEAKELYMPTNKYNYTDNYTVLDTPLKIPTNNDEYKEFKKKTGYHGVYDTLLNGGELEICDIEDPKDKDMCKPLSISIIRKKIPQFIKKHAKVWKKIKDEDADANDSDIFLQEMLYDDVIFN
ncbi:MAG: hypothetical protein WC934_04845 [Acidithiobacillus sp.]|jgi:hypothetical protein|uniref:hypothetical protein n=1 Tax=Acidithiobacillus sp. TaxID=1872118 RepID=UPI00355FCA94